VWFSTYAGRQTNRQTDILIAVLCSVPGAEVIVLLGETRSCGRFALTRTRDGQRCREMTRTTAKIAFRMWSNKFVRDCSVFWQRFIATGGSAVDDSGYRTRRPRAVIFGFTRETFLSGGVCGYGCTHVHVQSFTKSHDSVQKFGGNSVLRSEQ